MALYVIQYRTDDYKRTQQVEINATTAKEAREIFKNKMKKYKITGFYRRV